MLNCVRVTNGLEASSYCSVFKPAFNETYLHANLKVNLAVPDYSRELDTYDKKMVYLNWYNFLQWLDNRFQNVLSFQLCLIWKPKKS